VENIARRNKIHQAALKNKIVALRALRKFEGLGEPSVLLAGNSNERTGMDAGPRVCKFSWLRASGGTRLEVFFGLRRGEEFHEGQFQ
jgi:hypothetical protein